MITYDRNALVQELIRDEGKRLRAYRDSLGNWSIGVGHLLVGKELEFWRDMEMLEGTCMSVLDADIEEAERTLTKIMPSWRSLDDVRQRAMLNLAFNLGPRLSRFVGFRRYVEDGQWLEAGKQLKNSLWWKQVKLRGPRIRHMIETGTAWEGK